MSTESNPVLRQNSTHRDVQAFTKAVCDYVHHQCEGLDLGHLHSFLSKEVFAYYKQAIKDGIIDDATGKALTLDEFKRVLDIFQLSLSVLNTSIEASRNADWISGIVLSDSNAHTRSLLIARDGGYCVYCGDDLSSHQYIEIDHLIPQATFGMADLNKNRDRNLVCSCRMCNAVKKNLSPVDNEKFDGIAPRGLPFDTQQAKSDRRYWIEAVRLYITANRGNPHGELVKNRESIQLVRASFNKRAANIKAPKKPTTRALKDLNSAQKHWAKVIDNLDLMTTRCYERLCETRTVPDLRQQLGMKPNEVQRNLRAALVGVADYFPAPVAAAVVTVPSAEVITTTP